MGGLFPSKRVYSVGTSVSRVIQDKDLPNSVRTGIMKGLFAKDSQMAEYLLEELASNITLRAEQVYRYGKAKYVNGLPVATLKHNRSEKQVVQGVLETLAGQAVTLDYYEYGDLNSLHFGWQTLMDTYGYDPQTNEITGLSASKGWPVYLADMVMVFPAATLDQLSKDAFEQWGTPPNAGWTPMNPGYGSGTRKRSPFISDPAATQDAVKITYVWVEIQEIPLGQRILKKRVRHKESLTLPVVEVLEASYFQAKYSYQSGLDTVTRYFTYREGAGTYPELDAIFNPPYTDLGDFFPFAYFRRNKQRISRDRDEAEYKSNKKLVEFFGMDFDTVSEAIHTNGDVGDVESAVLLMAVPANTETPIEQRYLYDFFSRVYLQARGISSFGTFSLASLYNNLNTAFLPGTPNRIALVLQDKKFRMVLRMDGIFKKKVSGSIGPVGTYASGRGLRNDDIPVQSTSGDGEVATTLPIKTRFHYFRLQVSEAVYEEVQVVNLSVAYLVGGRFASIGDTNQPNLLVPLDRSITRSYDNVEQELLYARSLHLAFNALQVTKLSWYEQEWFGDLLMIVGIVLSVLSLGSDGGFFASLGTAYAAGGWMAVIILVAEEVLFYVALTTALKLFVKAVGIEAAIVLAVIAAALGMYQAFEHGGLAKAPWAKELLSLSSNLSKAGTDVVSEALLDLKEEAEAFGLMTKEKLTLLGEAKNLLEEDHKMTPLLVLGESPLSFYQRTIHTGNIGTYAIDAIHLHAEMGLRLPTLADTLGQRSAWA